MTSPTDHTEPPSGTSLLGDECSQDQLAPEIDESLVKWFGTLSVEERLDYLSRQVRAIEELRRGLQL
jgi:hypothetical protein